MVQRSRKKQTTVGGVILAALIALYGYARPSLNDHFQWNLPPLPGASQNGNGEHPSQELAKAKPGSSLAPAVAAQSPAAAPAPAKPSQESVEPKATSKPGPLAGRVPKPSASPDKTVASGKTVIPDKSAMPDKPAAPDKMAASKETASKDTAARTAQKSETKPASSSNETKQGEDTSSLRYGVLKDLGGERYVSPAGLLYTRGSAEGHRLDHLERHTVDDPGRPGKHGVFDGGMPGALKTIDRAFERAKTGQKTTKELDEGRVIYTVDMGGRVGYIGGQDGNRQRKPMARRVRIVLDQQRVITAYPL